MPAISCAASAPSPSSSGTPRRVASSAIISQVAAAAGSTQSAGPVSPFEAWWSMTTRGSRASSSRCRLADRPDALQAAAVGDDEQVVVDVGLRVGPGRRDARQERRTAAARDRRRRASRGRRRRRRAGRRRASSRACRRRGSRGRPRGRAAPTRSARRRRPGTAGVQGERSITGCRFLGCRCAAVRPRPPASTLGVGGGGPRPLRPAPRPRHPRGAAVATGVGSDSPTGATSSGDSPASSSLSSCRTRVPRSSGVVELDVELRDALEPQPLARARAGRTASPGPAPRASPCAPPAGR